ncbi:hypothetical protein [Flaviflexus equikiangi]|uniref:hypothetical protein n=1 Tax=Flaviflexus equikiangi TaxID=2758573 RepID=UPI0015F362EB|nr:hypothetical protein [Flaviflexus equikiangi]
MTPNHRIILWSTGLVVLGLFLSVIGLILYEFTPAIDRTWAPAITSIATFGLTSGGVLVITRAKDSDLASFARTMWRSVAYITAGAVILAAIVAALMLDPVTSLVVALVALQGPVGAWFVSQQMGTTAR